MDRLKRQTKAAIKRAGNLCTTPKGRKIEQAPYKLASMTFCINVLYFAQYIGEVGLASEKRRGKLPISGSEGVGPSSGRARASMAALSPHRLTQSISLKKLFWQFKRVELRFFGRFVDIQPGCPCSRHKQRAYSASRVSCKNSETPSGRSCPSRGARSRCGSLFLINSVCQTFFFGFGFGLSDA